MSETTTRLAKVTCEQSELIMGTFFEHGREHWSIWSALTDLYGEFGEPRVYSLWGPRRDTLIGIGLENIRHPSGRDDTPDVKPCEHYVVFLDWRDDDD